MSLINHQRVYCFVSFAAGISCGGNFSVTKSTHLRVTAHLVYLKTTMGKMPFVMSMHSANGIEIDRTPEKALEIWNESSNYDLYQNSILIVVLLTIFYGFFMYAYSKVRK